MITIDNMVFLVRRPFLTRWRNHYVTYRKIGFSRTSAVVASWWIARL